MQYMIGLAVIGIIVVVLINRKSPAYLLGGILVLALAAVASALLYAYTLAFDNPGQLVLAGALTVLFLILLYFVIFLARKRVRQYAAAAPERRALREEKRQLRMRAAESRREAAQARKEAQRGAKERPAHRRRLDAPAQIMEGLAGMTVGEVLAQNEALEKPVAAKREPSRGREENEPAADEPGDGTLASDASARGAGKCFPRPADEPERIPEEPAQTAGEEVCEPVEHEIEIEYEAEIEYRVEGAEQPRAREQARSDASARAWDEAAAKADDDREGREPEELETSDTREERVKAEQMKELLTLLRDKQKQRALEKVFTMLGEYRWDSDEKQKLRLVLLALENGKE